MVGRMGEELVMVPVYAPFRGPEHGVSHSGSAAKWLQRLSFPPPQSVLALSGLNPYKPAISHAWVGCERCSFAPVRCPSGDNPRVWLTGKGEVSNGSARFFHASTPRIGSAFRPPQAALESEDAAVHLRLAQRHPHHRSDADGSVAAPGPRRPA